MKINQANQINPSQQTGSGNACYVQTMCTNQPSSGSVSSSSSSSSSGGCGVTMSCPTSPNQDSSKCGVTMSCQ